MSMQKVIIISDDLLGSMYMKLDFFFFLVLGISKKKSNKAFLRFIYCILMTFEVVCEKPCSTFLEPIFCLIPGTTHSTTTYLHSSLNIILRDKV